MTEQDHLYLTTLLSKGNLPVRKHKRARGLLELNKGATLVGTAALLGVGYNTVSSWAKSYGSTGLSFLDDKPRSGRPIVYNGETLAKITAVACSEPPAGYSRWSLRLLSDRLVEMELVDSISFKQVGNILKKTNYSLIEKDNGAFER